VKVNLSLAAFPAMRHLKAAASALSEPLTEPFLGTLAREHAQLVPQNFGILDEVTVDELVTRYPQTQFRLHANVRVLREMAVWDLSNFAEHSAHWKQAATISRLLSAPAYSAHAGERRCSFDGVLNAARHAADLFGCKVAVEGHYPERGNSAKYHVATWEEYRALFESGVPYALDLSHLNIVAHFTGRFETTLVTEMLACERCAEVHLSDNDGLGDQHQTLKDEPWWWSLLPHVHANSVIFTEGNHRRARRKESQR